MRILLILLFAAGIFVSCKDKKTEPSLQGSWEYQTMEGYNGRTVDMQDSLIRVVHENNKGLFLEFSKDSLFTVSRKLGGKEEKLKEGKYSISNDGRYIISMGANNTEEDHLELIGLSKDTLKINTNPKSREYLVLTRSKQK